MDETVGCSFSLEHGAEIPFVRLLPGEAVKSYGGFENEVFVLLTNYRICLVTVKHHILRAIPLVAIESVHLSDPSTILIKSKIGGTTSVRGKSHENAAAWYSLLNEAINPKECETLFAWTFAKAVKQSHFCTTNPILVDEEELVRRDFKRLGYDVDHFRICDDNRSFVLCSTYPEVMVVPKGICHKDLADRADSLCKKRWPAVVWRCKATGSVLLRSSQPKLAIFGWRNSWDDKFFQLIHSYIDKYAPGKDLVNFDIRPASRDPRHLRTPVEGVMHCRKHQQKTRYEVLVLPDLDYVQRSFSELMDLLSSDQLLSDQDLVDKKWFRSVKKLLDCAKKCVDFLFDGHSVLVHCCEGWDRTPQIVSLAKIIGDEYYRTIKIQLAYHVYSGLVGPFIFDSLRESRDLAKEMNEEVISFWYYINETNCISINAFYDKTTVGKLPTNGIADNMRVHSSAVQGTENRYRDTPINSAFYSTCSTLRDEQGLASSQVEDTSYEPCALRSRRRGKNLWSACELQKLPLEVERYRQVCGRVQWVPLAQAWERSRNCNDAQRSINALKAYAKLSKRNTQATGATVPLPVVNKNVTDRNREESMERGNPSQETSISDVGGRSQTTPEACVTASRMFKLWSLLLQRFEKFYATATTSEDRVPIRRPKGEIPADLLEIGNGILNAKMPERLSNGKHFLSKLNVSVYAIARAIAATADKMNKDEDSVNQKRTLKEAVESRGTLVSMITSLEHELDRIDARRRGERTRPPSRKYLRIAEMHDVRGGASLRRLLRELMDRLATTQSTIKKLEDTMRRQFVRHKGSSYVVKDRADRGTTSVVPVTSIREYWEPIVGEHKLFQVSPAQKERAGDQGESETPRKSGELNEEEWRRLFNKVRP
ncbi:hypothetical protein NECAME_14201 [Necator americanus]|uniref:Myotubularin phosphatase domain-containing protein n=1 Tax=Necator americanus TaxID=51031 RepID=W2SP54_NECAM|nr:hypothetical protein NECAME_14201 [Necator americanus]ETN71474.1 hypothetical protein NECAME_14201 [Necator americanus]